MRSAALEDRVDARLALGLHDHVIGQLEELGDRKPATAVVHRYDDLVDIAAIGEIEKRPFDDRDTLVVDPRSIALRVHDDTDRVARPECASQVLVDAEMIATDEQHAPELAQRGGGVPQPERHVHRNEVPCRAQKMMLGLISIALSQVEAAEA